MSRTFGSGQTSGLPLKVTATTYAARQTLHTAVAGSSATEIVSIEVENGPIMVEIAAGGSGVQFKVEKSMSFPLNGSATVKVWDESGGMESAVVRADVDTQAENTTLNVGSLAVDTITELTGATGVTIDGVLLKDSQVKTDVIIEKTGAAGVTADGVLLKDGGIVCADAATVEVDTINEATAAAGVTIDGVLLKDSQVKTDTIVEKTGAAGVTADGVLLKDGGIVCADAATLEVDTVNEATAAAGVTIETVLVKDGNVTMPDAGNIVTNGTTGTKIGTATTQKLGFWNATPVVQPAGAAQAAPAAYATGNFGLDSDVKMQALFDLVVAMRLALVNAGIIKGAA